MLLAASLSAVPRLGRELVPELIQGEFFVDTELPPGNAPRRDPAAHGLSSASRRARRRGRVYSIAGSSNEQGGVAGELRENIGQLT